MRYARRQLVWFRHEANVQWIDAAGEGDAARERAFQMVGEWLRQPTPRTTEERVTQ
jgi:tRNA A37 N6-isopentenylltransferase MiaA